MSPSILELLKRQAPEKCHWCDGSGMVTVQGREWTPVVCICGRCDGSGCAPQPQEQS